MGKYCKMCGRPLLDNGKFCQNCGASVESAYVEHPENGKATRRVDIPATAPRQSRSKVVWICVGAAVVVLAIVIAALAYREAKIRKSVQEAHQQELINQNRMAEEHSREEEDIKHRQDSIAAEKQRVRDAYDGFVSKLAAIDNSLYEGMDYTYADLTGDGFPELIVHSGSCEADRECTVYEGSTGTVRNLGKFGMFHGSLAKGNGYLVVEMMAQGFTQWNKITVSGSQVKSKTIYENQDYDIETGEEHPPKELSEPWVNWYSASNTAPLRTALGL